MENCIGKAKLKQPNILQQQIEIHIKRWGNTTQRFFNCYLFLKTETIMEITNTVTYAGFVGTCL